MMCICIFIAIWAIFFSFDFIYFIAYVGWMNSDLIAFLCFIYTSDVVPLRFAFWIIDKIEYYNEICIAMPFLDKYVRE